MKKLMKVEGMHCGGCSARLKRMLEALPEVESAAADHEAGTAEAELNAALPDDKIKAVIENGGFTVTKIETVD
ncbi:MAG TPA: heavy-metal-associated domain-containing protein [Candidatus Gemmiger avistercoris]|uniref:Heavy-metal-associated domain-containing protein n=1 Tax=Candidatus Gemmiger avistercoris TaxID=2838606 RepID=A0A9D2FK59_9FIRM|nr:heavy metal-associated domain-containing protein [uncultured Subdoligranulum sp.]HIZ62734.1 heavy-metal-associated domain-containing protein [Candidatus Gemmiger avistercoris]